MQRIDFLAVDLGATSGRTMLATFDGQAVSMRELTRFRNNMIPLGGHLFWDIAALYHEILLGLGKAAADGASLKSIGIDTWGCDFAFFGKDGQLLGLPYCYRDSHTEGAMEQFFAKMPAADIYRRTGIQFMDFNSIFQIDTLKRNGCTALEAADKILFIPDALIYMLTGQSICEYTVASTSQMLNPLTKDLDPDILAALGIGRERFGRMTFPGTVAGRLSAQAQTATGLPAVDVEAVAGHDTASAVAAVPARDKGYAYLSCGTWSLLGKETTEAIITEESFRENFTNEGGIEGTTRFLKNICGLWIFEQCRKEFTDAPEDVGSLAALCCTTGFDSLIDPDAPCSGCTWISTNILMPSLTMRWASPRKVTTGVQDIISTTTSTSSSTSLSAAISRTSTIQLESLPFRTTVPRPGCTSTTSRSIRNNRGNKHLKMHTRIISPEILQAVKFRTAWPPVAS